MKNTVLGLIAILIIAGAGWWFYQQGGEQAITTFEECAAAGHPVMESYPRQCLTPDGRTLVEEIATTPIADGTYVVDPVASTLTWQAGKTLVPGYVDSGTIEIASGQVVITGGAASAGEVVIDMTSLKPGKTSNTQGTLTRLEEHLKSDDFFAVATYPTATFTLTSVTAEAGANRYTLVGNLTIRGVTESIQIPATIAQQGDTLTVIGEAVVDRTRYGVKFGSDSLLTGLADNAIIDDEFILAFSLQADRVMPVEPDGGTGASAE